VRASRIGRRSRIAAAGLAAAAALLVPTGAFGDDPASVQADLRSQNADLATRSQQVLLELYALESKLRQAERRIAGLEARAAELERREASARVELRIARRDLSEAERRLGDRLRALYVEGDVDVIAVILGAESLSDAVSAVEGLDRVATLDKEIVAQVRTRRVALKTAVRQLAARQAEVRELTAQAKAARTSLAAAQSERSSYLSALDRQQALNRDQIARLSQQASAAESRSRDLISGGPGGGSPPPQPLPSPGGRRTMTVQSTGYCLRGTTATGIPVAWGVVAVDPAVIPLGTRMFVPGYGNGVAADTGSAVRGAIIDLWFPSCAQALQWGRRTVTITLF
jgi:3D (Asp-Asp-Asp) domain-containing protein/peptidoglycan hydrolase CwlO-like protein